jgi:branched-subunit amino acid aminotransferase/4-amino-4-deoxychorismate lyase
MSTSPSAPRFLGWHWNGETFSPAEHVPLSDRGFRYGMAVFETLRVRGGEPEFFPQHRARLLSGCAERSLPVEETIVDASVALVEGRSGVARIYVTAGDGTPGAPAVPRVFVLFEERSAPSAESCEITICDEPHRPLFGGLKTANYWFNADALAHAQRRGFDEALIFNDFAELVSACMANVFLVHGRRISTPPRSSGARPGVIREWVIARRKVEERRLRREQIVSADEIFLTNSWCGVLPVATLEGRPLGPRAVGPKLAAELENRG